MIFEEGKYYLLLKAVPGEEKKPCGAELYFPRKLIHAEEACGEEASAGKVGKENAGEGNGCEWKAGKEKNYAREICKEAVLIKYIDYLISKLDRTIKGLRVSSDTLLSGAALPDAVRPDETQPDIDRTARLDRAAELESIVKELKKIKSELGNFEK